MAARDATASATVRRGQTRRAHTMRAAECHPRSAAVRVAAPTGRWPATASATMHSVRRLPAPGCPPARRRAAASARAAAGWQPRIAAAPAAGGPGWARAARAGAARNCRWSWRIRGRSSRGAILTVGRRPAPPRSLRRGGSFAAAGVSPRRECRSACRCGRLGQVTPRALSGRVPPRARNSWTVSRYRCACART